MMKPRLIVADDDNDFRALLEAILTGAGYEVLTAANGIEALRLCETPSVAAAIVDLVMPEKEGLETIFEMRRRFPGIKTIAMSGGGRGPGDVYLEMARQLGAVAALAKPFGKAELLQAVRKILDRDTPSDQIRSP
jgi:DNA-binding response OmpR family regulator